VGSGHIQTQDDGCLLRITLYHCYVKVYGMHLIVTRQLNIGRLCGTPRLHLQRCM
jgi:hypothetical protein